MPHITANGYEVIGEDTIDTASGAIVEEHKVLDPVMGEWISHLWFILPQDQWVLDARQHFETEFAKFTDSDLVNNIDHVGNDTDGWNLVITTITF